MAVTGIYTQNKTETSYSKSIYNAAKSGNFMETAKQCVNTKSQSVSGNQGVSQTKQESVVETYKKKHPDSVSHVNKQVNAGKKALSQRGLDGVSRDEMTMAEYQEFIWGVLDSIPFDATRLNDREIIKITDKGWEQMKNDPEYEAWVLGYTVENRSVRNPFAGWPGVSGSFCIEQFGASIEEHHGQSFPMDSLDGRHSKKDDEKSWWQKRHERFEELIEEQAAIARYRRNQVMEEYQQSVSESRQRLIGFFNGNIYKGETKNINSANPIPPQVLASAILAYDSNIKTL